jgi:hypothetical protein
MPIPLGILAAAGASQAPAGAFVLLESTVLTGSQASVEFTNLTTKYAATYQHLQVRAVVNQNTTGGAVFMRMQFNGDTAGNYNWHRLVGENGSVTSYNYPNASWMGAGVVPLYGSGSSIFSGQVIDILDPFETTKFKTIRSLSGITGSVNAVTLFSGAWRNTNSVTSMKFDSDFNSSLSQGTRFSLYGLKASA